MMKWLFFTWCVPLFLSFSITPDLYELSIEPLLEIRNETYDFAGNVTIHFHDGFRRNVIILDSIGLSVLNLTMDGKDVNFVVTDEEILIFPNVPLRVHESHRIEVHYTGKYAEEFDKGLTLQHIQMESSSEPQALVATQFEDFNARMVFPCVDWPNKKANFSLEITHPMGTIALSNGLPSTQIPWGGKLITSFEQPPLMSTYLVAFVVGNMKVVRRKTATGTEVAVYYTAFPRPSREPERILDDMEYALVRMTDITGTKYQMDKLDWIFLAKWGAMENFGLIIGSTDTDQFTVIHEVIHQWIGNLITVSSFRDIFIQEGFTEYYSLRLQMETMNKTSGEEELTQVLKYALIDRPKGGLINNQLKDGWGRYYTRGSSFFRMLADVFGEDSLDHLLRELIRIYGYQNHDHRQFFDLYKSIVDPNLLPTDYDHFIESWIQNEKFNPIISIDYAQNQYKISLFNANVTLEHGFPDVPVKILTLPSNEYRVVWLNENVKSFTTTDEEGSEYVVVDPNIHGFYAIQYSADYLKKIEKSPKYQDFEYQISARIKMLNEKKWSIQGDP